MPINYLNLRSQIARMGDDVVRQRDDLEKKLALAADLLAKHAPDPDALARRVEEAAAAQPALRCACPAGERLDLHAPDPQDPLPVVLYAADGSQINPSRHDPVEFGVINIGAIRIQPGSGQAPREHTETRLLFGEDLRAGSGGMSEEALALRRDLDERTCLGRIARQESLPVIALTDGPLELYGESRGNPDYQRTFDQYLGALEEQAQRGMLVAGYVDRPAADLVVRMLELAQNPPDSPPAPENRRLLRGLRDEHLFRGVLGSGERSALFSIQSTSARRFEGFLALHFFYLNAGLPGSPWIARVEVPGWVAQNPGMLSLLHTHLIAQCRQLAQRPYPYIIHRSHEVAVVGLDEKEKVQDLILHELIGRGIQPPTGSNKQSHKIHSTNRTRYSR